MSTTYLRPLLTPTDLASIEVSQYVRERAHVTAGAVGFGWIGTPDAPSTYQQLRAAYQESTTSGEPLPISNLACEPSIYARAEDNVAFRFWHDVHHVTFGLSFSLEDELELALWHLDEVQAAGFAPGSTPYALFQADLVGQLLLNALAHRFPFDQQRFSTTCAEIGLHRGLLEEIRRVT